MEAFVKPDTLVREIQEFLWNPEFWLPEGVSWHHLESHDPNVYYPKSRDIHWCIVVAVVFMIASYACEKLFIRPWARWLGVKGRQKQAFPNNDLEKVYCLHKGTVPASEVQSLSQQLKMRETDIEKWLAHRAQQNRATTRDKFCECCWHLLFYMTMFIYGCVILWDKDWMYESKLFFIDWPHHVSNDLYYYYLLEMGFYWSQIFTITISVKRKDFKELVLHHITTLGLMYFSWFLDMVRIGAAVLILHDTADIWVLSAKMFKYSRHQSLGELMFTGFAIVWVITRVIIYPYWILYNVIIEASLYFPPTPSHRLFAVMLFILQILHWIWTYFIFLAAAMKFKYGKVKKDARSDSESSDTEEEFIESNGVDGIQTHKVKSQ
ncbi:hypothetical protein SNE40_014435 [Patella caerulea]|uniref:TLC domain-containing protein n=1 Tax=Patella caerulea TaxID=87958 RepID=A0AAN8JFM6_PATCE